MQQEVRRRSVVAGAAISGYAACLLLFQLTSALAVLRLRWPVGAVPRLFCSCIVSVSRRSWALWRRWRNGGLLRRARLPPAYGVSRGMPWRNAEKLYHPA
jgi:hypothetical protein